MTCTIAIVRMQYKKATKGTFVFSENTKKPTVPSLYINKGAFTNPPPPNITLTISEGE